MSRINPRPSKLWKWHNLFWMTNSRVGNLAGFRSNAINFKISLFDPAHNGMRYLRTLIHCLCKSLSPENWERIKATKNRNLLGNPVTVRCNDEDVCLDYLQAVFELEFIQDSLGTGDIRRILEIGAGYGRTCHVIVSNHPVKEYYILDLDNCLRISNNYLKAVLDPLQFSKIHFVSADNIDSIADLKFDLCINIDSFGEMPMETVRYYLDYINKHCGYLYVKNPVCNPLASPYIKVSSGRAAFKNRICNLISRVITNDTAIPEVIDIFNTDAVKAQVEKYIRIYCPGTGWKCVADKGAVPWSYLCQSGGK